MNLKVLLFSGIAVISLAKFTDAADCESNSLGGQFCVNDNGTTSDSMPNEVGGHDTYSNDGKWKSSEPDAAGVNEGLNASTLPPQDADIETSSGKPDTALMGKDWNSTENVQSDGSATSSSAMIKGK